MIQREIIAEYEKILLKKKSNYSNALLSKEMANDSIKNAVVILRYAFDSLLCWKAKDICHMLTDDIIKQLRLEVPIKYLPIPGDIDTETRNKVVAHYLYPKEVPYSDKEMTISIYKKVLSKQLYGFPKRFLNEEEGRQRARVCLNYVIKTYLQFHSLQEMYSFFAKPDVYKMLKEYLLFSANYDLFDTPIDFLHESLPEQQQNEFLYHYYKFRLLYIRKKKELQSYNS